MREFFAKILFEITNHLKSLLKDANIEDRVKEQKFPDDVLKPFNEKGNPLFFIIIYSISNSSEYFEFPNTRQIPGDHF